MTEETCVICGHPMTDHWTDRMRGTDLVRTACPAPPKGDWKVKDTNGKEDDVPSKC